MIKANRTPHHQPEGSPGYADHPSLTPLRRGFSFPAATGSNAIIFDLGGAVSMLLQAAKKAVPGESRGLMASFDCAACRQAGSVRASLPQPPNTSWRRRWLALRKLSCLYRSNGESK